MAVTITTATIRQIYWVSNLPARQEFGYFFTLFLWGLLRTLLRHRCSGSISGTSRREFFLERVGRGYTILTVKVELKCLLRY